ncbi:MAG TPA: protein kinase, partial [Kofleriaceae bacterium]|nr:protein kinase [Kofleriaceae bacterium]
MRQPVPFGKYLLLDRISVGGMAEVFKAKSYGVEGFEKIIAIKRILPTMGEDRDFIKMFIDEAKIAGQLAHANICQIFELGRIDGSHFIAMEYIWGKDLLQIQNRLRKVKQHMPVPMACFVLSKVLEGLDYAHRKRDPLGRPLEIVHRDCSPQNVLVSYEGEVKVIDFGIAKATSRNSRTMAGVLKGKFGYMSPEQVRGLPLDRRSDLFALGTMLYECLTGERLFQGETDFSTLEKVRNVDIQPPRAINPAIPDSVETIILKALAKDVDDRYQWCSEMLADLQAFLMSQDVVFTAKTLSSWLKEVFQAEIERERQQLEQYKRVGRDGLIAGVPAAEAKLDVVEHLGEAPAPEGDATVLGGPSFDDIEVAAGASPDVGPAPALLRDEDNDFGEEAPTEIFGELDEPPQVSPPPPAPALSRSPTATTSAVRPPRPPPGRPSGPMSVPPGMSQPMAAQPMAAQPMTSQPMAAMPGPMVQPYGAPQASPAAGLMAPYGTPSQPQQAMHPPPGPMPVMMGPQGPTMINPQAQLDPQQMAAMSGGMPQQRTMLGVPAPTMQPGYAGYRPSQPQPMQYPSYPPGYAPPMPGYPSGPMPVAPLEQLAPPEGKKSTLVRDIGIGVAIAALVLVGFLVVKMFVLDKGTETTSASTPSSSIATIKLLMSPGVTAELYVDDKKVASVSDKQELPLSPGVRRIKLVGPNGVRCEEPVKLEAGKTTPLECPMTAAVPPPPSGSDTAPPPAQGSATTPP